MSSRPLNNDRTNYLIWRYLQEHGHAQTAARFQIDWGNKDPDDLPFSQYVRTHSLVYLLQKGLRYHELELSVNQPGANSLQPFFGPEGSASAQAPNTGGANDDTATTRKHARDSVNGFPDESSLSTQAPASKRSRRSNGQTSSASNGAGGRGLKSGDAMDVDESSAKREPASTNSPPGPVGQASGDMEMDLDSESKSNVFQRSAQGQSADATADAPSGLHAMAPNSVNSSAVGGGRAGSEETGTTAIGGAESLPAGPAAANAENANGHGHWPSQSGAAHHQALLDPRHPDQQEGAVQTQAQAQAQAQVAVQAALIPTLKDGRSVGVQSDKVQTVTDLGPETAVLRVPGKNVTHALWSPRDPALLATGGDALCRLWELSSGHLLARSGASSSSSPSAAASTTANSSEDKLTVTVSTVPNGHANGVVDSSNGDRLNGATVDPPFFNLDSSNSCSDSEVTAMVWSSDGERIAVARHPKDGGTGEVTIHSKEGILQDELPGGMEMVLNLYWNSPKTSDPSSRSLLLGVSHSGTGVSTLMVWDIQNGTSIEPLKVDQAIMDAAWGDDQTFLVCGDNLIAQATVLEGSIEPLKPRSDLGDPREWSRICYDPTTRTTAIASDPTGTLALLDASGGFHTTQAHTTDITAMKFQPLTKPNALVADEPRHLATGSADGSICIWNTKQPITKKYEMHLGKESQTLAISYAPDGYLLAAASWDTILFWHPETGQSPKAIWKGSSIGWHPNGSSVNGHHIAENGDTEMTDAEPESTPSLSWDADGKKVAFAFKEQIAVVSFRR